LQIDFRNYRSTTYCEFPSCGKEAKEACTDCYRVYYCSKEHLDARSSAHESVCSFGRGYCALSGCDKEIKLGCLNCQRVYYCCRDHLDAHWQEHEPVCYTTSAIAGLAVHSWNMWQNIDKGEGLDKQSIIITDNISLGELIVHPATRCATRN
jgi:hypothetical protein